MTASLMTTGLAVSAPSLDDWGISDPMLLAEYYKIQSPRDRIAYLQLIPQVIQYTN